MPIPFACPVCKTNYAVPDENAGRKAECKVCGQRLQVPSPERNKTVLGEVLPPAPAPPAVEPPPLPPRRPSPAVREPDSPAPFVMPPPPLPRRQPRVPIGAFVAAGVIGLGLLGGVALVVVLAVTQRTDRGTAAAQRDGGPDRSASAGPRAEPAAAGVARRPAGPDPPAGERTLTGEEVYRLLVRSSVLVDSPHGMGTGFIVDAGRRLVVTNAHVVGRERRVGVVFPMYDAAGDLVTDPRPYERAFREVASPGEVVARDPGRDLALVRVDRLGDGAAAAKLAARPAATGATVFSVGGSGADDNLLWRLTRGTVRGRAQRQVAVESGVFDCVFLETDAPVNPGDSGGPVMNDRGELVAVVSHFLTDQRQVSGNIDLDEVRAFLRRQK